MVLLQRYHSGTYCTCWICPSIWHGLTASVLSSAKPSILCAYNFLVLPNELIICAVGFLLSNGINCSLLHHREFSLLQVGLLRSIHGQQFNCFTGCHSAQCSSPTFFPLTVSRVRALLLTKNETQGFIPAVRLLVHMMVSCGSECTLLATLCQVYSAYGGLFILAKMLFDIDIEPGDGLALVWNKDVRFYRVKDSSGNPIAYFYFAPYSHPAEKCGGAWMDEVVAQSHALARDGTSARLPVGYKPSIMTDREVATILHEFGHALQHMLFKENEGLVSGIQGIEWAAVELPSQYMEIGCYERDTLMSIANPMKLVRHFMILPFIRIRVLEHCNSYKMVKLRGRVTVIKSPCSQKGLL